MQMYGNFLKDFQNFPLRIVGICGGSVSYFKTAGGKSEGSVPQNALSTIQVFRKYRPICYLKSSR